MNVAPLALGEGARRGGRRTESPRFILAEGDLRNERGARIALLSDAAALRAVLVRAPMALRSGPSALSASDKLALVEALRAVRQEGAWPLGSEDERAYLSATEALPMTGFAHADLAGSVP